MTRAFKTKETDLCDSEMQVRSFKGKLNDGPAKHYISVNAVNQWLTVKQARRLIKALETHIERVEVDKGASVMSGSRRKKKPGPEPKAAAYQGYGDSAVSNFVDEVSDLARQHFIHWEQDYRWKVIDGHKTSLVIRFDTWMAALKEKPFKRRQTRA
jgi:hypothetical protein